MSPVCVDTDSITNAGTTKKTTSHSQAGSASQYGVSRAAMRRQVIVHVPRGPDSRLVDRLEYRVPGLLLGSGQHAVAVQPRVVLAAREDERVRRQFLQTRVRRGVLLDDRLRGGHRGDVVDVLGEHRRDLRVV